MLRYTLPTTHSAFAEAFISKNKRVCATQWHSTMLRWKCNYGYSKKSRRSPEEKGRGEKGSVSQGG